MRISVRADLSFPDGTSRRLAYTLIQKEEAGRKWQVVEPAAERSIALDNKEVDRLATTLADFEGTEFVPGSRPTPGWSPPRRRSSSPPRTTGTTASWSASAPARTSTYAKVDGGSYLYLVPEWRVQYGDPAAGGAAGKNQVGAG